jgi:excisionase family DNA binding protein
MSEAYTIQEVSQTLKISVSSVKRLIKENKLKAFKIGSKYIINEISLMIFLGHKIEDCIDVEAFEKFYLEMQECHNENIDKQKFYEYYCSIFAPGIELPHEYYLIKKDNSSFIEKTELNAEKIIGDNKIILSPIEVKKILKYLDEVNKILLDKL